MALQCRQASAQARVTSQNRMNGRSAKSHMGGWWGAVTRALYTLARYLASPDLFVLCSDFVSKFYKICDKKLDTNVHLLYLACPFPDNISTTKEKSCVPYLYVKENRSIAL